MNRQYLTNLRNLFKRYFINKSISRMEDADFWYRETQNKNDARGNFCMVLSGLYMSLANLL